LKKILVFIFLIILIAFPAFAANKHIKTGASGTGSGDTWVDAYPSFAAVATAGWDRANIYYVAGGTYAEKVSITSASGAGWLIIKKAIEAEHGSATGWDAAYGTDQAVISSAATNPQVWIAVSQVEIDGVTGSGTSGHGIKINPTTLVYVIQFAAGAGPFHLHHIDIKGNGYDAGATGTDAVYQYTPNVKGTHISYCWLHDVTRNGLTITTLVGTSYSDYGLLFENNFLSETGGCTDRAVHGQGIQIGYATTDAYLIIRNNIFRNVTGTAVIAYLGAGSSHTNSQIYNNIFYTTDNDAYPIGLSPGIIATYGDVTDYFYIYNNVFYNISQSDAYGRIYLTPVTPATVAEVKNNLWMKCYLPFGGFLTGTTSSSNNGFYDNNGLTNPGNTESSDPFTNSATYDFTLVSGANAVNGGLDLSSTLGCTTGVDCYDITGTTLRGVAWDIGAYEYTSGTTPSKGIIILAPGKGIGAVAPGKGTGSISPYYDDTFFIFLYEEESNYIDLLFSPIYGIDNLINMRMR